MEFAGKYFDCSGVTDITLSDQGSWKEAQHQMLADFTGLKKVRIDASEKVFPLEELEKLPKLEELTMDVTGIQTFPQLSLPDHIKILNLFLKEKREYGELLASLRESSISKLRVFWETKGEFLLDDIADCSSLEVLEIDEGMLRIENAEKTGQLNKLKEISFSADQKTNLSFLVQLPALKNIRAAITETIDVAPLFEKKNLGLCLLLAQEKAEFSEERYPKGKVIDLELEAYTNMDEV